jgi:predicted metalloprotease
MLGPMSRRRLVALAVAALAIAACGNTDQGVTARRSDQGTAAPDDTGPTAPPDSTGSTTEPTSPLDTTEDTTPPPSDGGIIDFGDAKTPQPYDNYLNQAFEDITSYWAENFPTLYGGTFTPVSGIYALYPDRTDLPQSCQGPVNFSDVEGNAFYTDCGDIIVYDDYELLPQLVDSLGAAAVGVVAAHEYGHAIQERAGVFDMNLPTVDTEQQADCFAGAWAAHLARGEGQVLSFDDRDVKAGLVAMITVRDPPGITNVVDDPNGHGTAFDRVGAFQEGFIKGPERCKDFIDHPNPRIDLVFLSEEDFASGGNLPFDQILADLPKALDTFWVPTLQAANIAFTSPTLQAFSDGQAPACDDRTPESLVNNATYCQSTNTIVYDDQFVHDLYDQLGDLSFSYPIASAYSDAVQVALHSALQGESRVLLNDCLVGAWIDDIVPQVDANGNPVVDENGNVQARDPNQEIILSAGDLDEAVGTAVLLGDESSSTDVNGTAFEKIDAFRSGVLDGMSGCQARINGTSTATTEP